MVSSPVRIQCKGILFDMDGILVSSIGSVERSWTNWALKHHLDPEETCKIAHGQRAIDTITQLRPDLDAEAELKIIEDLEVADNSDLTVLPGVLDLLAALPIRNGKRCWTVVTSATERLARARMADGGLSTPEQLVTADIVTRGKPHPEPYLTGAAQLGIAPAECVVFEDSASGAKSGRVAGCIVIATTFSHPIESLEGAHYLVEDLTGMRIRPLPGDEGFALEFVPIARQA